jgi:quercetin dioxygenase-like cupin family protein
MKNNMISGIALLAFAALSIPGKLMAQDAAPASNEGLEATTLQAIDLGPEIEGMDGRELRLRRLVIKPGGFIGIHSHMDRPAVAYILQGTTTVTFDDGSVKRFSAGDSIAANRDTTHWHRNDEQEDMVLVTVDVRKVTK